MVTYLDCQQRVISAGCLCGICRGNSLGPAPWGKTAGLQGSIQKAPGLDERKGKAVSLLTNPLCSCGLIPSPPMDIRTQFFFFFLFFCYRLILDCPERPRPSLSECGYVFDASASVASSFLGWRLTGSSKSSPALSQPLWAFLPLVP